MRVAHRRIWVGDADDNDGVDESSDIDRYNEEADQPVADAQSGENADRVYVSGVRLTTELDPAADSRPVAANTLSVARRTTSSGHAAGGREQAGSQTKTPAPVQALPQTFDNASVESRSAVDAMLAFGERWHGVRYRWGGATRKGIDCSALVVKLYDELFGRQLPRTTRQQVELGRRVQIDQVRPGDLIFFRLSRGRRHVGIYVGEGRFLHASRSRGVALSSLDGRYWKRHFWQVKRVIDDLQVAALQP